MQELEQGQKTRKAEIRNTLQICWKFKKEKKTYLIKDFFYLKTKQFMAICTCVMKVRKINAFKTTMCDRKLIFTSYVQRKNKSCSLENCSGRNSSKRDTFSWCFLKFKKKKTNNFFEILNSARKYKSSVKCDYGDFKRYLPYVQYFLFIKIWLHAFSNSLEKKERSVLLQNLIDT